MGTVRTTEIFPSSLFSNAIRPGPDFVLTNETKIQQPSFVGIGSNGLPGSSICVMGSGAGRLQSAAFASSTQWQVMKITITQAVIRFGLCFIPRRCYSKLSRDANEACASVRRLLPPFRVAKTVPTGRFPEEHQADRIEARSVSGMPTTSPLTKIRKPCSERGIHNRGLNGFVPGSIGIRKSGRFC
jgi:hypothetical protein